MAEEDPAFRGTWSAVEQVVRKGAAGLCQERHDSVSAVLGSPQVYFAFPPSDVPDFEALKLAISLPVVAASSSTARSRLPTGSEQAIESIIRRTSSHGK